jgi:hypothetical protein
MLLHENCTGVHELEIEQVDPKRRVLSTVQSSGALRVDIRQKKHRLRIRSDVTVWTHETHERSKLVRCGRYWDYDTDLDTPDSRTELSRATGHRVPYNWLPYQSLADTILGNCLALPVV